MGIDSESEHDNSYQNELRVGFMDYSRKGLDDYLNKLLIKS